MFEAIYGSVWHQPYAFWAAGVPFAAFLLWQLGRARARARAAVFLVFQLAILTDAWLTASISPLRGGVAESVAIAFVVLGDARYFLLLERFAAGRSIARAAAHALAWSLVIPVGSLAAKAFSSNGRVLFLSYELAFALLAVGIARLRVAPLPEGPGRTWVLRLTAFEIAQYMLWALADVVILAGFDVGYLLRLVPNALYYVAFVPFAWGTLPEELRP